MNDRRARVFVLMLAMLLINAKVMTVHKADGSVERYFVSDVKKMTFDTSGYATAIRAQQALQAPSGPIMVFQRNGSAAVRLAHPQYLTVSLLRLDGRSVATLFDGYAEAGLHTYAAGGRQTGAPAGSWIGLLEVRCGTSRIVKPVTMVR